MKLELRVGGLEINPEKIRGSMLDASHYFVVKGEEGTASIYVAETSGHLFVPERFGFEKDPHAISTEYPLFEGVGGGYCYIQEGILTLMGWSTRYGAIPEDAAEIFVELIVEKLKKDKKLREQVLITGHEQKIVINRIDDFWQEKEYQRRDVV